MTVLFICQVKNPPLGLTRLTFSRKRSASTCQWSGRPC